MKHFLFTLLTLASLTATAQQWPDVTPQMRPGTRWWWQGSAVEAQRLDTLITQYGRAGIGTVEITPIYGVQGNQANNLSYLTTPWMQALNAVQTAAQRSQVDVDMNGGTGWPFGGPTVKLEEAAAKLVTKDATLTAPESGDGTVAALSWNVKPDAGTTLQCVMAYGQAPAAEGTVYTAIDVTDKVENNVATFTPPAAGEWRLVAVYCGRTSQAVKRAAPGGEGYVVDHYDSAAVANYLKRFDTAFGRGEAAWPHSFFCDSYEVYGADWTPRFLEQFQRYRGYDLRTALPQLLALSKDSVDVLFTDNQQQTSLQRKGYLDILADYRQTLSDLLLNNFTLPWTAWAHSHGVTTRLQAHGAPGSLLDIYAAADIPEIEGFGLTDFGIPGLRQDPGFTRQNYSDFATLKYASSAAHVTGKPLVSSETFTWLTEHFRTSLSQMKPDLDLMLAAGVNHIFFHGTAYTPDPSSSQPAAQWPGWHFYASIDMSPGNSIWRDAPAMMQYATRCQSWLQQGQPDNDFLLYANFQEAMHKNTGTWKDRLLLFDINTLSQKMPGVVSAQQQIEQAGYDCDFISDRQLLHLTLADDGRIETEGGARYRALIVTSDNYMPAEVRQHLDSLVAQGARITSSTLADTLHTLGAVPEAMRQQGMKVLRRRTDDGRTLRFIANLTAAPFQHALPCPTLLYDAMTGRISAAPLSADGQPWLQLRPGESIIAVEEPYDASTANSGSKQQTASGSKQQTDNSPTTATANAPVCTGAPIIIDNAWTLSFTEGTPDIATVYTLDTLRTWEGLSQETARYMGTGIYETTFTLSQAQLQAAPLGYRIDLGDVRESARIYVNGDSLCTLWAAPFTADIATNAATGSPCLRAGQNTLRIEVTNLPANRISQMDRDGITWRLFEDVNMLGIAGGSEGSRVESYASWSVMPSGLNSNVRLLPLQPAEPALNMQLCAMQEDDNHPGEYWPVYSVDGLSQMLLEGDGLQPSVSNTDGTPIAFSLQADTLDRLLVTPMAEPGESGHALLDIHMNDGRNVQLWLPLLGRHTQLLAQSFDGTEPPASGWNNAVKNGMAIAGFAAEGKVETHVAKARGQEVSNLYPGLVFSSAASNNFYLFPGRGMQPLRACQMLPDWSTLSAGSQDDDATATPREGDLLLLYQREGSLTDSLLLAQVPVRAVSVSCQHAPAGVSMQLKSKDDGILYTGAAFYRPLQPTATTTAVTSPAASNSVRHARSGWYTLQGRAIGNPTRPGLYIHNGRKVTVR